ncbi:MAG: hypothetical protein IKG17_09415 [Mogibacterium sp.]|nr:hypothetical protein [Mogibacterium sp.]
MGIFDEYLDKAKDLAEDAKEGARDVFGEVVSRAKEVTEEGSEARKIVQSAKEQSAAIAFGAKEKVQGIIQDARAIKEIKQGIAELEALPEIEGSIIYTMEIQTLVNNLRALYLLIDDERLDDETVAGEIKKTMVKLETGDGSLSPADSTQQKSEEDLAIENAKNIAYNACIRALDSLKKDK